MESQIRYMTHLIVAISLLEIDPAIFEDIIVGKVDAQKQGETEDYE